MNDSSLSRRQAVKLGIGSLAALSAGRLASAAESTSGKPASHPLLTPADEFVDVSRGNPKPYTLTGEALLQAKLTPDTWRLEITADEAPREGVTQKPQVERQFTLANGTALDFATLV